MKIETNISRIRRLAAEKEEENWRVRAFLKTAGLSIEEVDATAHRLFDEVSAQIDCTQCGNCCRCLSPGLSGNEVPRLADRLNIAQEEFVTLYLEPIEHEEGYRFKKLPCPFLSGTTCTVYDVRPQDCRSYPHLHKDEFVFRLMGAVSNCSVCPIVYHVYER